MAKTDKLRFVCQSCGSIAPKWSGQCPRCLEWNTIVEDVVVGKAKKKTNRRGTPDVVSLSGWETEDTPRFSSGIGEFDRVLGGGIVPGSVVLVGGDPGVGKTTLLMQAVANLNSQTRKKQTALYVSGEESGAQLGLRAQRLGLDTRRFIALFTTDLEDILSVIDEKSPEVVVIDSIQTMSTDRLESTPGSISQLRHTAHDLTAFAKEHGVAFFFVGHITKDGSIAGPKALEHLVDTVLYFEGGGGGGGGGSGGGSYPYRILKAYKNRFGPTNEVGVFEMGEGGLKEVPDPSELFLSERVKSEPGSAILAALEGTRTILVEVQSLTTPSPLAIPRRTSMGIDHNRVNIISAVLERRGGVNLSSHDIFVNVVGGIRIAEPALDLALMASLTSSYLDVPVDPDAIIFGEVGLSGEIRGVSHGANRIAEAKKLGFKRAVVPQGNASEPGLPDSIEILGVKNVKGFIKTLFDKK